MQLMERALPAQSLRQKMAWMRAASLYLNRYGITSVTNATGNLAEIEVLAALHRRGELTVRTRTAFGTVGAKHKLTPQFLADLDQAHKLQRRVGFRQPGKVLRRRRRQDRRFTSPPNITRWCLKSTSAATRS